MPFEMHGTIHYAVTIRVGTLKLFLVFVVPEVGVYVLAKDILPRPVFDPRLVRELLSGVAITEAACWVGWQVRVSMSRLDLQQCLRSRIGLALA